jgi:hypothetical protein
MPLHQRISCLFYLVFFLISPGLANAKYDGQNIQWEKIRGRGLSLKLYGGVNDIAVGDLNKDTEKIILWGGVICKVYMVNARPARSKFDKGETLCYKAQSMGLDPAKSCL